jgi:hypothetical protein
MEKGAEAPSSGPPTLWRDPERRQFGLPHPNSSGPYT